MPTDEQMQNQGITQCMIPSSEGAGHCQTPRATPADWGDNQSRPSGSYELNGKPVRYAGEGTARMFVVRDIAVALGTNPHSFSRRLQRLEGADKGSCYCQTPGGRQRMTTISTSGLVQVLSRLRGDRALEIRTWLNEVGGQVIATGEYRAPELPEQAAPSTAITPAATPSLEALAQMAETQLGIVRQMQQMQRDLRQEIQASVDSAEYRITHGLREEMQELRRSTAVVKDLIEDHGIERRVEEMLGDLIERRVSDQTSDLRHRIGELLEDVGVLQQRVAPPPGKSVLDQVRHTIDAYCRHS